MRELVVPGSGAAPGYRGRLAPSPTGYLHVGHAQTFWIAQQRAASERGSLILRNDDLDRGRCREEYVRAMYEDLSWLGLRWIEGPDVGGPFAPYSQSERLEKYRGAFERLKAKGCLFPCVCSRKEVASALGAPHVADDEPIYPGICRERSEPCTGVNWRFRVPDGELLIFEDGALGRQSAVAGRDFGDFLVWRKDDLPSYQLACVVDDSDMQITEVVRGSDLVLSTFRQLLLYRTLELKPPRFYHAPLVLDENGRRLAKRDRSTTLRGLRVAGIAPETIRAQWSCDAQSGPP